MAWTSTDARDVPPGYLKHIFLSSRKMCIAICVICDIGICKSEFIRKVENGQGFFVTRHTVVCHAHSTLTLGDLQASDNSNLTDLEQLSATKKILILQKHLKNIENGLNVTQEIVTESMDGDFDEDNDVLSVQSENTKKKKS